MDVKFFWGRLIVMRKGNNVWSEKLSLFSRVCVCARSGRKMEISWEMDLCRIPVIIQFARNFLRMY